MCNVYSYALTDYGTWTASRSTVSKSITVDTCKIYTLSLPLRYGIRIDKNESDPYESVEYLYDAEGMTPAKMNFSAGEFEYGDWADIWFVKDNKPCMLKSNGEVDYYLNPNDYTLKEDGANSDVANTSYDGNAMAQIPLCWVYRYEDDNYYYEIVSNEQFDENYKAYAHTRADGSIADYFYTSMFGASGSSSKLRSLSGQTLAQNLTLPQMVQGAQANGSNWNIDSWSRYCLIRTLLVLISKSLDTQSSFGGGYWTANASGLLPTGTLNDKGQFFGYNNETQQVKCFHIEGLWSDQADRVLGLIENTDSFVYVKMTPEGAGYQVDNVNGYFKTALSFTSKITAGFISKVSCSEYGMIPIAPDGSSSTYFCDFMSTNYDSGTSYSFALACMGRFGEAGASGAFMTYFRRGPAQTSWQLGCHLSF